CSSDLTASSRLPARVAASPCRYAFPAAHPAASTVSPTRSASPFSRLVIGVRNLSSELVESLIRSVKSPQVSKSPTKDTKDTKDTRKIVWWWSRKHRTSISSHVGNQQPLLAI